LSGPSIRKASVGEARPSSQRKNSYNSEQSDTVGSIKDLPPRYNYKTHRETSRMPSEYVPSSWLIFLAVLLAMIAGPRCSVRGESYHWNESALTLQPPYSMLPENITYEDMVQREIIEHSPWGCLTNSFRTHDNHNGWAAIDYNRTEAWNDASFLRGNTIWINEHMAVGHMYYDIAIMQVMQVLPIDRIVIQRSACNDNACLGVGTWEGFYKGYYTALIEASKAKWNRTLIPVYVRWNWFNEHATALYLNSSSPDGYSPAPVDPQTGKPIYAEQIHLHNFKCSELYVRRKCMLCFHKGMAPSTIVKFKQGMSLLNLDRC
jgi:hypothetical protein